MVAMNCYKCNVNTSHREGIGECYMVLDDIWTRVCYKLELPEDIYLCILCLEVGLGRQLQPTDFAFCPLNYLIDVYRSKRLVNRLTKFPDRESHLTP